MQGRPARPAAWDAVQVLAEPTRRRVYDAVRAAGGPLTRDDVAARTGLGRRRAAFHLDQLAAAGLLVVDFARPPGRGGPGAGRPAKRYTAAAGEVAVSVPERRYDLAARILAAGIRDGGGSSAGGGGTAREAALAAAEEEGRTVGLRWKRGGGASPAATLSAARAALVSLGYEPVPEPDGLRLANCPFDTAVEVAPDLVCGLSERLVTGVLAGIGGASCVAARPQSGSQGCCVRVETSDGPA